MERMRFKLIAHAINVAHCPDFSHESSWDGFNYSMQDSQGDKGQLRFIRITRLYVFKM